MIGIDLVDLHVAKSESNWRRTGYLEKIFTGAEQATIKNAVEPEIMVWLFWSMKEATYKVWSRMHANQRVYAPTKISCVVEELEQKCMAGLVTYMGQVYHTRSFLRADCIYTLSASQPQLFEQSTISITEWTGNEKPYPKDKAITVSHHGKYLALAW
ncbi:4'-phosphopantetheinyl transferase superfamily protein [Pedobacter sp. MC2016-14]|uniref:4'-phosphopantetheinyl transferase family protein n=1 Tax=Pedobacter sp. MC2016-14 TaxID=2897327 RepID=UPI001E2989B5|nr:4'-phosphopantetheinyl transferase superfamily protein [Pedobacter sp. MC2016-14]MCD0490638.1 4'-phosphopantetheinyl transferase superfamily protein [Pedobacter sp. MC2016-14]